MNHLVIQICSDENCPGNRYFQNAIKTNSLQEAKALSQALKKEPENLGYCAYCQAKLIPIVVESG
ncbi:hypothetical protein Dtox_1748 [Desulfofarcimen acetoxidans DSM 771]|jgi:hypothetical protein|uniref:Uncharacterized protein n=1 Tax=Desulfofarcimen acetoxidans (strain ATCC 49208 / DSM 771 / KCTC 5769 / VKM B-1644 / 5575) TaxID=485916 RepID=C8VX29_DESAS|nr:hypothetical protein [Desulfofarcimen acetoxidans]ACV62605.1 hypothetical protein Dtox_1748 [Desulfofarcimen acetoxidans DSM 771]